ncbi:NPP1 protein [Phytophthora nicotianae]|uniref:NPP1 protein n=2 Tax=Phytophthora nicotianae TaxID=4792 RepID=A0A0W8CGN8_PHYNI|nr:NPP1 protein [Phytophthora nicotianae]KUF83278.1 hypothetical protein AM588_10000547 [Phytophthora nicotianae]
MKLGVFVTTLFAALVACAATTIDHDKIEPFPQPKPVTMSEKAAIKFKPQLFTSIKTVCAPFPAVNAAGDVTGGLKGTNGNDACRFARKGSQVYGRAGWHKDMWAIMYAWYFPKGFWMDFPTRRHDWKNVVVWIDNPDLESPKIVAVSMSKSGRSYHTEDQSGGLISRSFFNGFDRTSLRFHYQTDLGSPYLNFAWWGGEYQDLIMWEQLTDPARVALNDIYNFGDVEVPFSDNNFEDYLDKAWPF